MIAKSNTLLPGGRFVREGQKFTEAEVKKYGFKVDKPKKTTTKKD